MQSLAKRPILTSPVWGNIGRIQACSLNAASVGAFPPESAPDASQGTNSPECMLREAIGGNQSSESKPANAAALSSAIPPLTKLENARARPDRSLAKSPSKPSRDAERKTKDENKKNAASKSASAARKKSGNSIAAPGGGDSGAGAGTTGCTSSASGGCTRGRLRSDLG